MNARMVCPECGITRDVADAHDESYYDGDWEYGFISYDLSCGHHVDTPAQRQGRSPDGDRYADRPTVRSIRAQDIARTWREENEK